MKLDICLATRADLPTLIRLYAEMDGKPPLSPEKAEKIWAEMAKLPEYHVYLASLDGEVVGTFSLLFLPTMMRPGFHKAAILEAVTISPSYRSQGIGRSVMKIAMQLSAAAGCYKIILSSNLKRDRAHAFYESLGFKQHGWSFSLQLPQT